MYIVLVNAYQQYLLIFNGNIHCIEFVQYKTKVTSH